MKAHIILSFFFCFFRLQGMERTHNDKTLLMSLKDKRNYLTIKLKYLSENDPSVSKTDMKIRLPKSLPKSLNPHELKSLENLSKLFSLAQIGILGQKSKLLEFACDYEQQLAELPSDSKIVAAYPRALWDNYYLLCRFESIGMNHEKLQKHLWWKINRILDTLEKTKCPESIKLCLEEANYSFDLVSTFMARSTALLESNKPLNINEARLKQEYKDLATRFINLVNPDEKIQRKILHYSTN